MTDSINKKHLTWSLSVALLLTGAAPMAFAQADRSRAASASAQDWSGWSGGLSFGAGFYTGDEGELRFRRVDGSDNSAAINTAFGENFSGTFEAGYIAGGHINYLIQDGNYVYGAVADLMLADIAQEQSAFSATPATYVERREIDFLTTLRGKFGVRALNTVLPFITAGVAYGDVDYSWKGNSGAFRGTNGDDGSGLGFAAGLGVDIKITEDFALGMEYLYVNLGDASFETRFSGEAGGAQAAFGNAASGGSVASGTEDDFEIETLRINATFSF